MGITWGGYRFDGPFGLASWIPACSVGVYVVMAPKDLSNAVFRVLYFGESDGLHRPGFYRGHPRYGSWVSKAGSERDLYIGVYRMPNSTPEQRQALETLLVERYRPACNR